MPGLLPKEVAERRVQEWECRAVTVITPDGEWTKRRQFYGKVCDIERCVEDCYPKKLGWLAYPLTVIDGPEIRQDIKEVAFRVRSEIVVWLGPEEEAPRKYIDAILGPPPESWQDT